jgi:hypothetical protein
VSYSNIEKLKTGNHSRVMIPPTPPGWHGPTFSMYGSLGKAGVSSSAAVAAVMADQMTPKAENFPDDQLRDKASALQQ